MIDLIIRWNSAKNAAIGSSKDFLLGCGGTVVVTLVVVVELVVVVNEHSSYFGSSGPIILWQLNKGVWLYISQRLL